MFILFRFGQILLGCLFAAFCAHAQGDTLSPADTSATLSAAATSSLSQEDEEWLRKTPLKTKIGQLFIFGFMGNDTQRGLRQLLIRQKPGAIIVFGRNIKTANQIIDLNREAQRIALATSGQPLLIAVDQEGGNVIRIHTTPSLPSALALGGTGDPELVKTAGRQTGLLLKTLGFNMNLAPVLDVADPANDAFVGTRTFGKDPENVGLMGTRFALGLQEAGVLPTAKHFPGHGGVSDSHRETPVKQTSADDLAKIDLVPFSEGVREIPESAVMLAHIAYPKLDPSGVPATFSKPIVTDLLRKKLGFNGLVVTDDIEMAGAFVVKSPAERAIRAIEAGVDLVMVAWNKSLQANVVDAVWNAVKSGRISEARVDESLRRILRAKREVASSAPVNKPSAQQLHAVLRSDALRDLAANTLKMQFANSVKSLTKKDELKELDKPIFVFAATEAFAQSLRAALPKREVRFYRLSSRRTFDINRVLSSNPEAYGVLHLSGKQSAYFANTLASDNASRVVIVNSETLSLIKDPENFLHAVNIHFRHPDLGRLTAQYVFGASSIQNPKSTQVREPTSADKNQASPSFAPANKKSSEREDN